MTPLKGAPLYSTDGIMHTEDAFEVVQESVLFESLGPDARRSISRMAVPVSADRGERIIKEGEIGDALYLIVEGSVRVTVASDDPTATWDVPVARLTKGDHFGEQALLRDEPAPRTATVQAIDECRLLKIPAAAFREVIQFDDRLRRVLESEGREYVLNRLREQTRALQSVEYELSYAGHARQTFTDRQVIFRQGETANDAFLLTSGTVVVKFLDEELCVTSMVEMVAPRLFGESGVLTNEARSGTAVAVGEVELTVIPGAGLVELHRSSPGLRNLCQALQNIYDVPGVGRVTHYHGTFMDMPSHCLLIQRDDGSELVGYKVIESEIFALTNIGLSTNEVVRYETDGQAREVSVEGGRLVGLTSYGHWSDSQEMTAAIMAGVSVTEQDLALFEAEGTLRGALDRLPPANPSVLCRCMNVATATVSALIEAGISELSGIMTQCGAGTVCGGCRPHIGEMLGHRAWTACHLEPPVVHTDDIWSFRFAPVKHPTTSFRPGQHIVVRAEISGQWVTRSYTLTSAPGEAHYEITVKREPGGLFSNWLFEHAADNPTTYVSEPQGDFVVDPTSGAPILFFGAGIGITPAIGLLRGVGLDSDGEVIPTNRVLVDYSARTSSDFIAQDLFERAAQLLPGFRCRRRVTSLDGRITRESLAGLVREYGGAHVYICGPKSFETSVVSMLGELGVAETSIHVEEFASVAAPQTEERRG